MRTLVERLTPIFGERIFLSPAPIALLRDTKTPYCVFEIQGEKPIDFIDTSLADVRHVLVGLYIWTDTEAENLRLMKEVEQILVRAPIFATVESGIQTFFDEGIGIRGISQAFSFLIKR